MTECVCMCVILLCSLPLLLSNIYIPEKSLCRVISGTRTRRPDSFLGARRRLQAVVGSSSDIVGQLLGLVPVQVP